MNNRIDKVTDTNVRQEITIAAIIKAQVLICTFFKRIV